MVKGSVTKKNIFLHIIAGEAFSIRGGYFSVSKVNFGPTVPLRHILPEAAVLKQQQRNWQDIHQHWRGNWPQYVNNKKEEASGQSRGWYGEGEPTPPFKLEVFPSVEDPKIFTSDPAFRKNRLRIRPVLRKVPDPKKLPNPTAPGSTPLVFSSS